MANMIVNLKDGFRPAKGEDSPVYYEAELRETTAADLIQAAEESEKPMLTAEGWKLLQSETLMGVHTLRRQIVRIGEYDGPFSIGELGKLTGPDLHILQLHADQLDTLALEVAQRGRESTDGEGGQAIHCPAGESDQNVAE